MKKIISAMWAIAIVVFFVDWIIVGVFLLSGNYEIKAGICIAIFCFIVIAGYPFYKLFRNKCPHCRNVLFSDGKFCPHCGKEIRK